MLLRHWPDHVDQSDWDYAKVHWQEYDLIFGCCHTLDQKVTEDSRYVPLYVDDSAYKDTVPTAIETVARVMAIADPTTTVLVHCLAGQNRSSCISALVRSLRTQRPLKHVLEEQSKVYAKETPPHVWGPPGRWPQLFQEWCTKSGHPWE